MRMLHRDWIIAIACLVVFHQPVLLKSNASRMRQLGWYVTLSKKHEHIPPVLHALHWLPVRQRIVFKILLLTFKAMTGSAPDYITDLIHHHKPVRQFRSSSQGLLDIPPYYTEFYGARAFATTAPKLWNKLPPSIRNINTTSSFKRALKTYLFKEAFPYM